MAAVDVVLPPPPPPPVEPANKHSGERLQKLNGVFKPETTKEHSNPQGNFADSAQKKNIDGTPNATHSTSNGHSRGSGHPSEGGDYVRYNPSTGGWEDGMIFDARNIYPGIHVDNGQHMYYASGYGYPPQPTYCSQPPGPYMSNMGAGSAGYGPQAYGPYYQQVPSSSVMQYYPSPPVPSGQEGSMFGYRKFNSNDVARSHKFKSGVGGRQGHQVGFRSSLPLNNSNQRGGLPAAPNASFHDSAGGYEFYSQQWHSSAGCLQSVSSSQNAAISGNCTPPLAAGCGRHQAFPRVQSAPNIVGKGSQGGLRVKSAKTGSAGSNWRAKEVTKHQGKCDLHAKVPDASADTCTEESEKSCTLKPKSQPITVQVCADLPYQLPAVGAHQPESVNRNDYNKEDFETVYEAAKFFIIKSYSEDDVHKSIKYSVWSSTPNGNKRLDEAYRDAQAKSESISTTCRVFFFFSVNSSGQFCGVAEMVGSVDFGRNMDFWLQGKWNGCLPVKWHIIKDVSNCHFRHLILSNNDNKPVTHSRDTQEVHMEQGIEMLKIFKFFPLRTSLLDDFAFYDGRQKILQERKSRQLVHRQQAVKQVKERPLEKKSSASEASTDEDKENGRPGEQKDLEPKVTSIECKVAELKVDVAADSNIKLGRNENNSVEDKEGAPLETTENRSKFMLDLQSLPEGKDDTSTISNYKKALLEGIQGKAIALDKTIGV